MHSICELRCTSEGGSLPTIATQPVPELPFAGTGPANASHSNIIKRYANMNACFSCGFNVEDGHTSKTCPAIWRRANHQEGYNRSNAQQYIAAGYDVCTKAMHKTQYPNFWRCGAEQVNNIVNLKDAINVYETLDPIKSVNIVDDDEAVVTSNKMQQTESIAYDAVNAKAMKFARMHAVADTGTTSLFVMEGLKMSNVKIAKKPLSINLPDGEVLKSMHTCNMIILGLPTVLTGHIVQGLTMASLVGIRILCKAGCQVIFTEEYCDIMYNGKLILRGYKGPQIDLWTCENILYGFLYVCDLAFVILKIIYSFKFPKRFLEISSRDLTSFFPLLSILIILRPDYSITGTHFPSHLQGWMPCNQQSHIPIVYQTHVFAKLHKQNKNWLRLKIYWTAI
jgi:hypothetical protein